MRKMLHNLVLLLLVVPILTLAGPRSDFEQTDLDKYVHQPDSAFSFSIARIDEAKDYRTILVELVSQNYLNSDDVDRTLWKHSLKLVVPRVVQHDTAMLMIGGGDNNNQAISQPTDLAIQFSVTTNSVVAELGMVPNQPLTFATDSKPRWEDALIAYTWDKFFKTGDSRWPARMAMTKSATAAMTAIQRLLAEEDVTIKDFFVAGASKRGWTTWTTAAVDDRVRAIAPIVIDLLNIEPSFEHHWRVYGFWSPAIQDYVDMSTTDWWRSAESHALFDLVAPLSYRDRYTMPKLILNAAGDEFFVPTSSQFYYDKLPDEKYLRYVPNVGHGIDDSDALETVLAFYASILNQVTLPNIDWVMLDDGAIKVTTNVPPKGVSVWSASNKSARDFRLPVIGKSWVQTQASKLSETRFKGNVSDPDDGWRAYFVEVVFDTPFGIPFKLTSPVRVTPDRLPFEYIPPKKPKGGFLSQSEEN